MSYMSIIKKEYKFHMSALRDDIKRRRDKDYFYPSGTHIYTGRQGKGKTLSAVKHLQKIKNTYPKSIIVTNLSLTGLKEISFSSPTELEEKLDVIRSDRLKYSKYYIRYDDIEQLSQALVIVNNDKFGVIFMIDEIHLFFNALESKNIPMYVFTEISQQRKQRKVILGTSQLFARMGKPFREQVTAVIICKTYFNLFTTNKWLDGESMTENRGVWTGDVKKRTWFFHSSELRNAYDTFQKVISGREQFESSQDIVLDISKKNMRRLKK